MNFVLIYNKERRLEEFTYFPKGDYSLINSCIDYALYTCKDKLIKDIVSFQEEIFKKSNKEHEEIKIIGPAREGLN